MSPATAERIQVAATASVTPEMFAEVLDILCEALVRLNNADRDPRVEEARKKLKAVAASIRPAPPPPAPAPAWVPPRMPWNSETVSGPREIAFFAATAIDTPKLKLAAGDRFPPEWTKRNLGLLYGTNETWPPPWVEVREVPLGS